MKKTLLFASLLSLTLVPFAGASEMSGMEIMKAQKAQHEANAEVEQMKMVLLDNANNKETRELKRYSKKDKNGNFQYLIQFTGPADVKNTALLTKQQKDREDDQWLYLPALGQKLKRIAQGSKKGYFMGTDFAYEDLRAEKLEDHTYNLLRREKLDSGETYVVEALPSNEEENRSSGYGKRILWITVDGLFTVKTDFYDHSQKLLKTQTSTDVKPASGNKLRAGKVLMTHHQNKHQSLLGVVNRVIDGNIDDMTFTERHILEAQ